jgi:hypothetical protein
VPARTPNNLAGATRASFASFLLLGHLVLCSIAWVPEYLERLGISFTTWGLILGLAPVGAIAAVLVAPSLINRIGVAPMMRGSAILAVLALIPLGFVTSPAIWGFTNMLFHFLASLTGVAVNTHGVLLQKKSEGSILSGLHAGWSVGAVSAASSGAVGTLFIRLEVYLIIVASITLIGFLILSRFLLAPGMDGHREENMGSARIKWAKIPARIWILAFALLCVVLPELAIFEWSAILSRSAGIDLALRAVPFGAFMMGMIIGRLSIDSLSKKFDIHYLSVTGALISGFGLGTGVLGAWFLSSFSPGATVIWLGSFWFLGGLGLAPVGPTVMLTASLTPGISTAQAIATLSFVTQAVSIVAKIAMGAIAENASVSAAFIIPVVALFAASALVHGVSVREGKKNLGRVNPPTGPLPVATGDVA